MHLQRRIYWIWVYLKTWVDNFKEALPCVVNLQDEKRKNRVCVDLGIGDGTYTCKPGFTEIGTACKGITILHFLLYALLHVTVQQLKFNHLLELSPLSL